MFTFFLVLHFIFAILLILAIVIQKKDSDGALLTSGGSASGAFTPRGEANILTKATYTLAFLFFANCLIIAKLVDHNVDKKGSLVTEVSKNVYVGDDKDSKVNQNNAAQPKAPVAPSEPVKNTESQSIPEQNSTK